MERGIHASDQGRKEAADTLKLRGWTQEYLAGASQCTRQTVNRFLAGKAIEKRIFQAICAELGLDWGAIADLPVGEQPDQRNFNRRSRQQSDFTGRSCPSASRGGNELR